VIPAALTTDQIVTIVTYAGFVVAIIALTFSVWQVKQGLRQAEDYRSIRDAADHTLLRLERVSEALPTRVLGEWPTYLRDIARFVERTEQYLKIVKDVPSYGIFSNLEGQREYQKALEDSLLRGSDLDIIFMSQSSRRRLNDNFASAAARSWATEFASVVLEWAERVQKFDPTLHPPQSFEGYLDVLEQTNEAVIRRLHNAARIGSDRTGRRIFKHRETELMIPLYIWVRDGVEAIFAVAVFSPDAEKEIAFITTDLGLVKALEAAFDRYGEDTGSASGDLAPAWP